MKRYNLNNTVVIYPSINGWQKMYEIYSDFYNTSLDDARERIDSNKTDKNGYKDQLWCIMSMFGDMFYNGTNMLSNMNIELIDDIKYSKDEIRSIKIKTIIQ